MHTIHPVVDWLGVTTNSTPTIEFPGHQQKNSTKIFPLEIFHPNPLIQWTIETQIFAMFTLSRFLFVSKNQSEFYLHWLGWYCYGSNQSGRRPPWRKVSPHPPPSSPCSPPQDSSQPLWTEMLAALFLWIWFVVSCLAWQAVWPAPVVAGTELAGSSNFCSHLILPGQKIGTIATLQNISVFYH